RGREAKQSGERTGPVASCNYSRTALNAMQNVKYKGGRNGAIGPDSFQANLRAGWRGRVRETQAIELFLDIFNITNRVNFDNPITANSDRRLPSAFLVLTNLAGGGGLPRQAQLGFRYTF